MLAAEFIKNTLSFDDILLKYGLEADRKGYMHCPFHKDKTPSLRIHPNKLSFKCYGCGKQGTFIDFVGALFNLSFSQAITRIDYDFNLGLLSRRPGRIEIERQRRELEKIKAERYFEKLKDDMKNDFREACLDVCAAYEHLYAIYAPVFEDEELSPEFKHLLELQDVIDYIWTMRDVMTP